MIRIHGKRVLAVLAFLMAIYVFFQLELIRSTRSSFSDIVREQPDVENHVRQTPLREHEFQLINSFDKPAYAIKTLNGLMPTLQNRERLSVFTLRKKCLTRTLLGL